jgi:prepilin-type processing-associated H-X9-DG protein
MKSKTTFTKKDLVVVLICIVFLIANIAAVGEGGRKRAKRIVCLSNLYKWGQIFQAYTADNDGFFNSRTGLGSITWFRTMWPYVYKPYYNDKMMRFCPTAVNPKITTGTFGTWNYSFGSYYPTSHPSLLMPGEREYDVREGRVVDGFFTGSYGMNRYIENVHGGSMGTDPAYWRHVEVEGASQIPILMDCMCMYYWASSTAAPPLYDGAFSNEMQWICINRHNGFINVVFMDWSARKVGLKELWTLKHSRTFDTCGPWTICGFGGNKQACAAAWDAAAPWMKDFPEY